MKELGSFFWLLSFIQRVLSSLHAPSLPVTDRSTLDRPVGSFVNNMAEESEILPDVPSSGIPMVVIVNFQDIFDNAVVEVHYFENRPIGLPEEIDVDEENITKEERKDRDRRKIEAYIATSNLYQKYFSDRITKIDRMPTIPDISIDDHLKSLKFLDSFDEMNLDIFNSCYSMRNSTAIYNSIFPYCTRTGICRFLFKKETICSNINIFYEFPKNFGTSEYALFSLKQEKEKKEREARKKEREEWEKGIRIGEKEPERKERKPITKIIRQPQCRIKFDNLKTIYSDVSRSNFNNTKRLLISFPFENVYLRGMLADDLLKNLPFRAFMLNWKILFIFDSKIHYFNMNILPYIPYIAYVECSFYPPKQKPQPSCRVIKSSCQIPSSRFIPSYRFLDRNSEVKLERCSVIPDDLKSLFNLKKHMREELFKTNKTFDKQMKRIEEGSTIETIWFNPPFVTKFKCLRISQEYPLMTELIIKLNYPQNISRALKDFLSLFPKLKRITLFVTGNIMTSIRYEQHVLKSLTPLFESIDSVIIRLRVNSFDKHLMRGVQYFLRLLGKTNSITIHLQSKDKSDRAYSFIRILASEKTVYTANQVTLTSINPMMPFYFNACLEATRKRRNWKPFNFYSDYLVDWIKRRGFVQMISSYLTGEQNN